MSETINARDPLYHSLDLILKLKGVSKTAQEVLAGLPIEDHRVPIKTFVRAANRVGIRAQIKKIPLKKVVTRSLPAILLLREDKAVYVMRSPPCRVSHHIDGLIFTQQQDCR